MRNLFLLVILNMGFQIFETPCFSLETMKIPDGIYQPFFIDSREKVIHINSFFLDKKPVSKSDFNKFLIANPEYQKSKVKKIYVESQYLKDWNLDLLSKEDLLLHGEEPVTYVSWFIARKYCAHKDQRLPLLAEWEYASDPTNKVNINLLLKWYAAPNDSSVGKIGMNSPNKFGLYDMHGLIWEWVEDFNSVVISTDSRAKGDKPNALFCAGGSVNATDSTQYATFMRFALRSGLRGNFTLKNLGFRCAKDLLIKENKK